MKLCQAGTVDLGRIVLGPELRNRMLNAVPRGGRNHGLGRGIQMGALRSSLIASVALLPRSAFATIAPVANGGNLGVNTFRRGGIGNLNASIARSFAYAKTRMTLRAESINLMNTPQFAEPGAVFGTPEFGSITNTLNDGRTFRLGLTLGW